MPAWNSCFGFPSQGIGLEFLADAAVLKRRRERIAPHDHEGVLFEKEAFPLLVVG